MRNGQHNESLKLDRQGSVSHGEAPHVHAGLLWAYAVLPLLLLGCASNDPVKSKLEAGYAQLQSQQYSAAMASANDTLQTTGATNATASALYLRGRAYQDRPKSSPTLALSDLQYARNDYTAALTATPDARLESRIHAGLGEVAFDQDDYATAQGEFTTAANTLDKDEDRAKVLYKLAKAQQRLGHWDDADRSFTAVVNAVPGSPLASDSRNRIGVRSFTLRVATFSSVAGAESAAAALAKNGVGVVRQSDPANPALQILRAGPYATYRQALQVKRQLALTYADAIIEP